MNNKILIHFKMSDSAVNLATYFYCDTPLIFTLNIKIFYNNKHGSRTLSAKLPLRNRQRVKNMFSLFVSAPTTCLHISNRLKSSVINTTKQISFAFFTLLKMLSLSTMPSYEIMAENKCDEYDEQMLSIEELGARFATSSINVY